MLGRFKEGSSYAGFAAVATTVLPTLGVAQPITIFVTALFGLVAFFLKDKK